MTSKVVNYHPTDRFLDISSFFTETTKQTLHNAAAQTVEKITPFWNKARVPIRHKQDSIKKVEALYHSWLKLKKHKKDRSKLQIERKTNSLLAQREKGRRGSLGSVDQ